MPSWSALANTASILGLVVGIAGLIYSFKAFIQAQSASKAAREARDKILIRSFADELELVSRMAGELIDFLTHDRLSEAALRVNELTAKLSEMPNRRGPQLGIDDRNSLLTARTQVDIIGGVIGKDPTQPLPTRDRQRIVNAARGTSRSLNEVLGTVKSRIEYGASDA